MVVRSIFPKINYPNDKNSIKHIITEYEKVLEYKLDDKSVDKKLMFIIYFFIIVITIFLFKSKLIPASISVIYSIPSISAIIYDAELRRRIKKCSTEDTKILFKSLISFLALTWLLLYIGVALYEALLFNKWTYKEYWISLGILSISSGLIFIYVRMKVTKKFIKKYQYGNNKFFTMNSVVISIIEFLICIAYFRKPYLLLLITTYIFLPVYLGAIVNIIFEYLQYDKIQELKKKLIIYQVTKKLEKNDLRE